MLDTIFGIKDHLSTGQECARAVLIFFYGLVMLRISGKRSFARWSAIDMVLSIIIGSNLSRALTGSAPMPGTLAAVAIMVALHLICTYMAAKSEWWSKFLEGEGVPLAKNGKIDDRERTRRLISEEDLREAMRGAGVEKIEDVKSITLETSGRISVIRKIDPILALNAIAKGLNRDGEHVGEPYQQYNK